MKNLTLEQIFGKGATQNASELIINLNSLANTSSPQMILFSIIIQLLTIQKKKFTFTDNFGNRILIGLPDYSVKVNFWDFYQMAPNAIREEIIIEIYEQSNQ